MPRVLATAFVLAALSTPLVVTPLPRQGGSSSTSGVHKGKAAYYSQALEGHKTACGGTYDGSEMTTAHRTLRCGTKLRITNLKNGKSVEAVVNDRGPTSHTRIVDVSRAVAEQLDFVKQGTTTVEIEVVE